MSTKTNDSLVIISFMDHVTGDRLPCLATVVGYVKEATSTYVVLRYWTTYNVDGSEDVENSEYLTIVRGAIMSVTSITGKRVSL